MNMVKLPGLVCMLALAAGAAYTPSLYQFTRVLEPGSNVTAIAAVTLDSALYNTTQNDLRDLRLADQQNSEVPYLIKRGTIMREWTERVPQGLDVLSLTEASNDLLVIELTLIGEEPKADVLSIDTPLKDFERSVSVFSSNDRVQWKALVENALIFDYSRYMDISNHDIQLPAQTRSRYLKLVLNRVSDEQQASLKRITRETRAGEVVREEESTTVRERAFRIDRVRAWYNKTVRTAQADEMVEYPVVEWTATNDIKRQDTVLDLQVQRPPLTDITLDVSNMNFSRVVELQVSAINKNRPGDETWQTITTKTISQIHIGGFIRESLHISFPEQRRKHYRLVIHNYDNPPLNVTGIHARGPVYRLHFLPEPGRQYVLFSGNETAAPPKYDIAALQEGLRRNVQPSLWSPGPVENNPAYTTVPQSKNILRWLNTRVVLGIALAIMVAGLGLAIWHTSRRIETGK